PVSGRPSALRSHAPDAARPALRADDAPFETRPRHPAAPPAADSTASSPGPTTDAARDRAAVAQTALLSALVAGTPAPEGFDHRRLGVQSRALAAKRADVVAKVAPELPEILGDGYRRTFLAYARNRPMAAGYRRDALDFAEHLLIAGRPADDAARRRLTTWWQDRAAARPPRRTTRLVRAARAALVGR
ncbi:endonuclease, partial [Streptomyces sp. NPDC048411]